MFFDDLTPGHVHETGSRTLSEDDIVGFAKVWDFQDFHTDPEAAKASPYGGLIASGFHTLLTAFTLELEAAVWREASMGSPGIDELRWLKPERPGDTLRMRTEVVASRPSRSRPDRGITTFAHTVLNQRDEPVMTWRALVMLARRPDRSETP